MAAFMCNGALALTIVQDGTSTYSIVIPDDPIPAEKTAAEELVLHIEQMSGAKLVIVREAAFSGDHGIFLGHTRLAKLGAQPDWEQLGKEGYLLRTAGGHLIIAGGRPRGTLYGVYDLMQEQWGCRWFTLDTSHFPKTTTLTLPDLDTTHRPVFELRMLQFGYYSDWFWDHFDQKFAARVRWNFGHRSGNDRTHGGEFKILPSLAHNYVKFLDPGRFGAEFPDYYALHDGKRLNYVLPTNDVELCLSNPGTAAAAVQTITEWLRASSDVDMIFIGQSDTAKFCQCDNCNAARTKYGGWDSVRRVQIPANLPDRYWNDFGGFAGLQIEFINKVARALENEFPDITIGTYAYYYNRQPPHGIRAHKNVMVLYAPWIRADGEAPRCYCHAIDSGPVNDDFSNYAAELSAWTRIADKVYVYDYWLGAWLGQPVNIPTIRRTMRFYRKAGVEGIWLDGLRGVPAGFEWMTLWLWSQLAWNPDFDADRGIHEFCGAYYGAAAPYIKQYIDLANSPESYSMELRPDHRGIDRTKAFTLAPYTPLNDEKLRNCQLFDRMLTADAINRGYELFEQARKAVSSDPKAAKHVEYTRMALQTAMLEWLPGTDPRLNDETELLIRLAKEVGFTTAGFGQVKLDEYQEAIRKKIDHGEPLYRPRKATNKRSAFGATPPAEGRYVDGTDYEEMLLNLKSVANLPMDGWRFKDDPEKVGVEAGFYKQGYSATDLATISIGKHWDQQGYPELKEGWYRLAYASPKLPTGKRVFLQFEAVDESAWLYIDGKLVTWYDTAYPQFTWDKPFLLEVTGSLKSQHEHVLVIRVRNTIGAGGIWKPVHLMVESQLIDASASRPTSARSTVTCQTEGPSRAPDLSNGICHEFRNHSLESGPHPGGPARMPANSPNNQRRILYNSDFGNAFNEFWQHTPYLATLGAERLKAMAEDAIDELADAGVDTLSVVVFGRFLATMGGSRVLPPASNASATLRAAGYDPIDVMVNRCHERGIEFVACFRMNDRHSDAPVGTFIDQHPQWHLRGAGGGPAVDFVHEPVRQKMLDYVAELLASHDLDGIQFDWMRWCHMFEPGQGRKNAHLLTDFTRRTRGLLDAAAARRGRSRLLLGARVPQTLAECDHLGFDLSSWIKEDLVDYLVPSDFLWMDFNFAVEQFVKLAEGTACKIYPAVHASTTGGSSGGRIVSPANYRAAARNFYAYGADGIETYNYQWHWDGRIAAGGPQHSTWSTASAAHMWPAALGYLRDLRDAETVSRGDRHYLFYPLWEHPSPSDAIHDDRIKLDRARANARGSQRFRVAEDLGNSKLRATMQFKAVGMAEGESLDISLNGTTIQDDFVICHHYPDGQLESEGRKLPSYHLYIIDLHEQVLARSMVNGDNELAIGLIPSRSSGQGTVIIDELEVYVYVRLQHRPPDAAAGLSGQRPGDRRSQR